MELNCPTMVAHPTVGQPDPLSLKVRKTSLALTLGARTTMTMMIGKKAKKWAVTNMPSASGRCLTPKILNAPMPRAAAKMKSVACHLVGVYASSLMTMTDCMMTPTSQQLRATILCQEMVASQPMDVRASPYIRALTYRKDSSESSDTSLEQIPKPSDTDRPQ